MEEPPDMSTSNIIPISQVAHQAGLIERTELAWPERAKGLKIIDAATLAIADEERGACKDLIAKAHERHDPTCASAYKTWQLKCAERKTDIDPLEEAVAIYDRSKIDFARAEKERAAAEQRRIEREDYQRQLEQREAVVEHVEATGGTVGEVQSIAERSVPLAVAPAEVMQTAAAPVKSKAAPVLENWKGEITDMWAFLQFAVQNNRRELAGLVTGDKIAIGSIARSTKGAMDVPGLRIWDDGKVTSAPKKAGA